MTDPKGLAFAAYCGRVVASLQHLPCQKTKPKGLCRRGELWWCDLSAYTNGYMRIFRKTNPEGLPRAADYGRVVALLQRLPYQKTKPKGLRCGCGLCRLGL